LQRLSARAVNRMELMRFAYPPPADPCSKRTIDVNTPPIPAIQLAAQERAILAGWPAAIGIAASSARTRLQSIPEKTAMHRQAELLLMIDALAECVL